MGSPQDRLKLLATSWTLVAEGYNHSFVSRFLPWTHDAVNQLVHTLPPKGEGVGTVAVPACGPGQELSLLAAALPKAQRIVGIDLAEGMVRLARERVEQEGLGDRVEVRVGDASQLEGLGPLSAVFSVFGLQQMPQPAAVLANWARALSPGGVLCVCFWPQQVEASGPWQRLQQLTASFRPQPDWEAGIPGEALAALAGSSWSGSGGVGGSAAAGAAAGTGAAARLLAPAAGRAEALQAEGQAQEPQREVLLRDERVAHAMEWPSVEAFWEGMVQAGPWHSRLLFYGEEHMQDLRRRFMDGYPDPRAPLRHTASARLVCIRRPPAVLPPRPPLRAAAL